MTKRFQLTVIEIIQKAFDRIGSGPFTGDKLQRALTNLQLVMVELANEGLVLSLIEERIFNVSAKTYTFANDIRDVNSIVDITNGSTVQLNHLDLASFNKAQVSDTSGRPTQYTTHKKVDATTIQFYPVPDQEYTFRCIVDKDATSIQWYDDVVEIRQTYLPAVIAGLVFYMVQEDPMVDINKAVAAKELWEELKEKALDSDRERAPLIVRPSMYRRY